MPLHALKERFARLTSALDSHAWRRLGAIAAERTLGRSVLVRMSDSEARSKAGDLALDKWIEQTVATGLLIVVAPRPLTLTSSPTRETELAVHPDYEELVLRELAQRNELEDIAIETQTLLGPRSVSDLAVLLQTGNLREFLRRASMKRLRPEASTETAREWLRASSCEPFDAVWLKRTWGDQTLHVATRVLGESLEGPSRCDGLHAWLSGRIAAIDDGELRQALENTLCQHAILRGDVTSLDAFAMALPSETRLAMGAAGRFLAGDLAAAQQLLDKALMGKRGALPRCGAITPMLALMLCARDTETGRANAKRLLASGTTDAERGAARAYRMLSRYMGQAEAHHRRIDFHQLNASAGAWEILLSALTVHLTLDQPATRATWSQHLVRKAILWRDAGYVWLGKQSLLLAKELSAQYCEKEITRLGLDVSALQLGVRELEVWALLERKPEWRKTLEALALISDSATDSAELGHRVAWFVDMSDGSLSRPALQEYRVAAGGWSQGQRMSLPELYEHQQGLPPEDLKVLACTRETADGHRDFTPDAYEMLIGHPRVLSGARRQTNVDVVRGVCRVETEEEGGYIRVVVEPEGAELGVNVVPQSETRLVVYRVTKAMRRVIEALPQGVRIPKTHEPELLRVLAKLAQSVEVRSPELGAERSVEPDSTPCLRISPISGAWRVQAGVRPFGVKGRFFVAGVGKSSVTFYSEGQRLRCERDLVLERSRVDALIAECPTLYRDSEEVEEARGKDEIDHFIFGEDLVLGLLSELRDAKTPNVLEWPESTALRLRGDVTSKSLHGRLRAKKGWYLATGGVRIDEVTEIALNDLVRAPALADGRFLRFPNGEYLEVEKRIRHVMATLRGISLGKREEGGLSVHPGAVAALRDLTLPDSGFEVDRAASAWLERVEQSSTKTFAVPASLRAELRPYQVEGFYWLCRLTELGLGACLADDMGLGKTLQILALLLTRSHEGPALVVAPTSVCGNWVREMQRFAPALVPVEYVGKDRASKLTKLEGGEAGTVVICSYALLQQDAAELAEIPWGTAVLDEAQFIKNAESLRARAAFGISAKQRIAATGTPVENHFGDLWSIFQFLNPGLLSSWPEFNRRFVRPIERDGNEAPQKVLRQIVQPYILRRLKKDVLSALPPLTEVTHEVHLSKSDAVRYALLRKQIHDKLYTAHGKRQNKIEVLAEITRLRRFCCHPKLVFPDATHESAKIHTFLELVEELCENGHRALVFSQYVDFLTLVREQLEERAIRYEYLDGSIPQAARPARVDAFQNGSASLFLISLKAGGFGLNLTAADYVIHLDPWWNPAVESQATDRAHRIGQDRRVTVYRLITKNTIEEKIIELHAKKQRLARAILDGGPSPAQLSADELVQLIEGDGYVD